MENLTNVRPLLAELHSRFEVRHETASAELARVQGRAVEMENVRKREVFECNLSLF